MRKSISLILLTAISSTIVFGQSGAGNNLYQNATVTLRQCSPNDNNATPEALIEAIRSNDTDTAARIMIGNADYLSDWTVAIIVTLGGVDIIQRLLNAGIDPNMILEESKPENEKAHENIESAFIPLLLERFGEEITRGVITKNMAPEEDFLRAIDLLYSYNLRLEHDLWNNKLIDICLMADYTEAIDKILDLGVDPNKCDDALDTLLMHVKKGGPRKTYEALEVLLKHGFLLKETEKDEDGNVTKTYTGDRNEILPTIGKTKNLELSNWYLNINLKV